MASLALFAAFFAAMAVFVVRQEILLLRQEVINWQDMHRLWRLRADQEALTLAETTWVIPISPTEEV